MPPALDGLLPNTDGPAIDDEYTAIIYAAVAISRRNHLWWTAVAVLVTAALAVLVPYSPLALAAAVVGLVYCVRMGRQARMLVRALRIHHRLITGYPWRAATLISAERTMIRVGLDEDTLFLVPKLANNRVYPDTVRDEQVWLCGPDEAGWVRVRGTGQVISQLYQRVAAPPKGAVGKTVSSGTGSMTRWFTYWVRSPAIFLLFGVLLVIGGARAVHPYLPLAIGETAIGLGLVLVADILRRLPELRMIRRMRATEPVSVALRLTTDIPRDRLRAPAEAEYDAPDGRTLTLRMPKAKIGLLAHLRAGLPAALYGELAPGRSVVVVITGQELTRTRAHVARR